jgi:predicted acetylornithine/succinylornithine family transaminase
MSGLFGDATSDELMARARDHYTPNYTQRPVFAARGEGVWIFDRDGKPYMDLVAGIAVSALGHAHPRLTAAIAEQAGRLIHASNLYFNEPALALMEELRRVSFGDRVFFTNSGAESNEAALKLARRYWSVVREVPNRAGILAFEESFHGRTMATVTLTGQPKYHAGFEPMLPGVHYATFDDLQSVRDALDAAGGTIGTILIEPIQCEGGMRLPSKGFLPALRALCDERDLLLAVDEVQTGVGRCATWFATEDEDVRPDIMSLAKGLGGGVPLGAMITTEAIAQAFQPGSHASTFGGNPLATRAGLEVVRTIEEEGLLEQASRVGAHLGAGLGKLASRHGDRVVQARGRGLLWGLELRTSGDPDLGKRVVAAGLKDGLLLNAIQGKILRFTPPLIIEEAEIDQALETLDAILDSV